MLIYLFIYGRSLQCLLGNSHTCDLDVLRLAYVFVIMHYKGQDEHIPTQGYEILTLNLFIT